MNKLFVGLLGSAFAFGSVAATADGQTPAQPDDKAKLKAERDAALGRNSVAGNCLATFSERYR
jgi:hypothetical protein